MGNLLRVKRKILISLKGNKLYTILLVSLFCLSGYGQNYMGTVINKDSGVPIDGVYIGLLAADSLMIDYVCSDERGKFALNCIDETDGKSLSFTHLGYKNRIIALELFRNGMEVALQAETFQLREVKVSAQRIVEKRDTLIYSVAGFAMPQDQSIADVIAKMPGLEVKQDGKIEFNGKGINKFYVEGLDLMGNRYALASNNISRKRVKAVQVLRNHQPVEVLREKSFSEQAALNLVLEDDSKYSLVGTVDGGAGANTDDVLYSNRLLGMLFGKNRQNLSIYKNDNTGYDLFREINPVTLRDVSRHMLMEDYLVSAVSVVTPNFDRSRYTFNQSHLVATNHLEKVTGNATLRTQISYFNDLSERSNEMVTTYFLSDSVDMLVSERNKLRDKYNRMDIGVGYEKNNAGIYLKNKFSGTFDWLSGSSSTVWNNREQQLESQLYRRFLQNELELMLPLASSRYLAISSINTFNQLPQNLLLYTGEIQKVDYSSFYSNTYTSFQHRVWGIYIKYSFGLKASLQSVSTDVASRKTMDNQRLDKWEPYLGPLLTYQDSSLKLELGALIKMRAWNFHSVDDVSSSTSLCPDLNAFAEYTLSGTSSVNVRYKLDYQLPDLRDAYRGDMFVTYRTKINNSRPLKEDIFNRISLGYQYSQPIRGLFFSLVATASFIRNHSAYSTMQDADDGILSRERMMSNFTASNYMLTSRFSKSFNGWKSILAVNGMYLRRQDAQMKENGLADYNLDNCSASVSFTARPVTLFSFEVVSAWQFNRLHSFSTDNHVNQLRHTLKLVFPISSSLMFNFDNALYQSIETKEDSWFMDFSSQYSYKRVNFELRINNIMGHSRYEQEFVTSIERTGCLFKIRPREVIAKVSFAF